MINELDGLTQPIIDIYNQIEYELIIDIAKRFDTYDTIGGSLEWELKKLDELGTLNADMVKTIAKYSKKTQNEIYKMLKKAGFANIDFDEMQKAYNAGAILVDPITVRQDSVFAELVETSYKELNETFRMIRTKALESAKQAYMDVVNRSYIEVATGTYDYNTSIKNAIQRMAEEGITGATYKRGGKTVRYSLEATVRRDTLTAAHKLANQSSEVMCEAVGTDYVEISSHIGARVHPTNKIANHAGWQGKVFKIHGEDDEYPNLKDSTGYPDDILGLGGVNCRHRMFPFVPGVSTPNPMRFSEEENKKAYELSQRQRKLERDMRKIKKKKAAAEASGDKEKVKKLKEQIKLKGKEIDEFCEKNNLRRDRNRELVTEQISKKVAKSGNGGIIKSGSDNVSEFKLLGKIETQPLEEEFGKLMTDEIIVTNERIFHIKERHPEDYALFELYGSEAVNNPDIIIKDSKNSETVFMIKQLEDTNLNVVAKLILETGNPNHKNSVMTFYRIRNRNLKKLLDKNKTLYKKE